MLILLKIKYYRNHNFIVPDRYFLCHENIIYKVWIFVNSKKLFSWRWNLINTIVYKLNIGVNFNFKCALKRNLFFPFFKTISLKLMILGCQTYIAMSWNILDKFIWYIIKKKPRESKNTWLALNGTMNHF